LHCSRLSFSDYASSHCARCFVRSRGFNLPLHALPQPPLPQLLLFRGYVCQHALHRNRVRPQPDQGLPLTTAAAALPTVRIALAWRGSKAGTIVACMAGCWFDEPFHLGCSPAALVEVQYTDMPHNQAARFPRHSVFACLPQGAASTPTTASPGHLGAASRCCYQRRQQHCLQCHCEQAAGLLLTCRRPPAGTPPNALHNHAQHRHAQCRPGCNACLLTGLADAALCPCPALPCPALPCPAWIYGLVYRYFSQPGLPACLSADAALPGIPQRHLRRCAQPLLCLQVCPVEMPCQWVCGSPTCGFQQSDGGALSPQARPLNCAPPPFEILQVVLW